MMDTVASLRAQLDEAREKIRWLEDAMRPPDHPQIAGLKLWRSEQTMLHALFTAKSPLNQDRLAKFVDVTLGRVDIVFPKSVDVAICRLRKRIGTLNPPITIRNARGHGYWLDDESKARLATLWTGGK